MYSINWWFSRTLLLCVQLYKYLYEIVQFCKHLFFLISCKWLITIFYEKFEPNCWLNIIKAIPYVIFFKYLTKPYFLITHVPIWINKIILLYLFLSSLNLTILTYYILQYISIYMNYSITVLVFSNAYERCNRIILENVYTLYNIYIHKYNLIITILYYKIKNSYII